MRHNLKKTTDRIPISPRGMSRKDCMQTLRQHCINSCYRIPTHRLGELINQSSEHDVGGKGEPNDTPSSPIWDSGLKASGAISYSVHVMKMLFLIS